MQRFLALCKVLKKANRFNYDEVDKYLSILYNTKPMKKLGVIGSPFTNDTYLKYSMTPEIKLAESFEYSHLSKKEKEVKIVDIRREPKIYRNAKCLCGSGKKYKKCCINQINKQ